MTHPLLSRAHLEAVLVGLVLLRPSLAKRVDPTRLSPAALALLEFARRNNTAARASLLLGADDEYQERLALRVDRLTMDELRFYPAATLVALVNALPVLSAARPPRRSAA